MAHNLDFVPATEYDDDIVTMEKDANDGIFGALAGGIAVVALIVGGVAYALMHHI